VNWTVAGKIGLVGAAVVVAGKVFDAFKFGDIDPSGLDAAVAGGFSDLVPTPTDLSSAGSPASSFQQPAVRVYTTGVTEKQGGCYTSDSVDVGEWSPPHERKGDH
jgi:hypothetical protein